MIEIINNENKKRFGLLRHILRIDDYFVDLRDHQNIKSLFDELELVCLVTHNQDILEKIYTDYNSGFDANDEVSMMNAVCSPEWQIRSMAALNVADPNALIFDKDYLVRAYLVKGLLADRRFGVAHTNLRWLDVLAKDEHPAVRTLVAQYGLPAHLDLLVKDSEPMVRQEVAAHAYTRHLDILIKEFCYATYLTIAKQGFAKYAKQIVSSGYSEAIEEVAKSGHATKELLSIDDLSYTAIHSIAKYGLEADVLDSDILNHKNLPIQAVIALAERGLFLDKLIDSKYMMVRMAVAGKANKEQAERLAMDKFFEVRLIANKTLRLQYN